MRLGWEKWNLTFETTISHINYWDQVNSWKNLLKFGNGLLCRNNSFSSSWSMLQDIGRVEKTEVCTKKMSQILANNIDNGVREIGLRIYVRYCLKKNKWKIKGGFEKHSFFFALNPLFLMFAICEMVLWLIGLFLSHYDPQKNWSVKVIERYHKFLSLKVNILSIQSVLFSWLTISLEHQ